MKKITLSAAALALALMGCSDAGMDNSVASTSVNEVKNENTVPFLAKYGSETCVNPRDAEHPFGNKQTAVSCGGYRAFFSSMKDRHSDGGYWMYSNAIVYEETGTGGVDINKVINADYVAITVCGTNCREVGSDVVCDEVKGPYRLPLLGYPSFMHSCGTMYDGDGYGRGWYGNRIGIITTFAAIVNNGTNNSKTLMATTTNGFGSEEIASKMYWKYVHNYSGN